MKELFQTILGKSKERISNPIIGAFGLSWIIFNWKPIFFIFFSNKSIESKIIYVDLNYSNIGNLLILPLVSMIIYVLLLPYLNLILEYLLEFSRVKRNAILISKQKLFIENKKELAIEEIKLEEAQAEYRERKSHNKLLEELETSIRLKDEQLKLERERSQELNKVLEKETAYLNNRFKEDKLEFDRKMNLIVKENQVLRDELNELNKSYHKLADYNSKKNLSKAGMGLSSSND